MNTTVLIITIISGFVATIATCLGGFWWVARRLFEFGKAKARFENTEKKVDALPCENHHDKLQKHESELSGVKEKVGTLPCEEHHDTLQEHKNVLRNLTETVQANNRLLVIISKWIMKIDSGMIEELATELNLFSAKHSPRQLNAMGEKLFTAIDGAKFLEENKETLFQSIKDRKPLAALDVEQYAYLACRDLIDTPEFTRLKDFVYEEPAWDMGNGIKHDITLNNVCFVLGLALRDMYLEEVGV